MKKSSIIALLLLNGLSGATFAEDDTTIAMDVDSIQTNNWNFGIGYYNLDKTTAQQECIDSSATYIHFGYEGQDGNFLFGGGISGYLLGDNCKFSQDIIDGWGDRSTESSDANAYGLYGELGYSFPITPGAVHFDLTGGVEKVWAERGISNCSNCYSENINLDSGFYIRPKFKFMSKGGFTFTIGYNYFPSADINNGITLTFGYTHGIY